MTRFPIYMNYDLTAPPVGFVEIDEDQLPPQADYVLAPMVLMRRNEPMKIDSFGAFPRVNLDTRPGVREFHD